MPNTHKIGTCIACNKPNTCIIGRGRCRSCYDRWLKQHNPEYKRRQMRNHDSWAGKHVAYLRRWQRQYSRRTDPEIKWARMIKYKYGITPKQYWSISQAQYARCAVCGKPAGMRRLAVDHDHTTGGIRGLLCFRCNFGLGWFQDDVLRFKRIVQYLSRKRVYFGAHKPRYRQGSSKYIHIGRQ